MAKSLLGRDRRRGSRAFVEESDDPLAHFRRAAGSLQVSTLNDLESYVRDQRSQCAWCGYRTSRVTPLCQRWDSLGLLATLRVEDGVPLLRVEMLGQLHRSLHVGEQHSDLLAFSFERRARGEDFRTPFSSAPQSPQNFLFAGFSAPQCGHRFSSATPQSPQNLLPVGLSPPQ